MNKTNINNKEKFVKLKESDDEKIREAILRGLIEFRDAPDLEWSNFGGKPINDCIAWLEKKGEKALSQANEHAWLYLVSDVLTWKDGIGQYLDDPRVQELAKKLCSEYSQKLYNPSDTGKNEQKSADKIEPKFKVGDKIINNLRKYMGASGTQGIILEITEDRYIFTDGSYIPINSQDSWELVSGKKPKFDPKTLQVFDKVLARMSNESYNTWYADFVAEPGYTEDETPLTIGAKEANMVIPYNDDTKHLVGTTEEAPEFYRYWED